MLKRILLVLLSLGILLAACAPVTDNRPTPTPEPPITVVAPIVLDPATPTSTSTPMTELPLVYDVQNFMITYQEIMPKGYRIWAGDTMLCLAADENTYYVIVAHGKAVIINPQVCGVLNASGSWQFFVLKDYSGDQFSVNNLNGTYAIQLGTEKPEYSAGPIINEWHPLNDDPEHGRTGIPEEFKAWAQAIIDANTAKDIWSVLDAEHNRPYPYGEVIFYHTP